MSKTQSKGTLDGFVRKTTKPKATALSSKNSTDAGDILREKTLPQEATTNKRLSVERIYQKKTQLEHILLRPDSYVGSVEYTKTPMWVYDTVKKCMVSREISYVPGLYKIFDEILVNAADNKQRDSTMNCIRIEIEPEDNKISIYNNGRGIPVIMHKGENMYVPSLIFGHLLTSSNYDDKEKKVTGGRNGYGAKLCNIFSKKFIIETSSKEYSKMFKQVWTDNMGHAQEPVISSATSEDFTKVTFYPDLAKFGMETLDKDIVDLFTRRAYDIAGSTKGVKVFLNGERLPIKTFKDYVNQYLTGEDEDCTEKVEFAYEDTNDRWQIAVAPSEKGFQQVSFVNSISTTKGGTHVEHVAEQIVGRIIENLKKKDAKKKSIQVKPFQVKNHLWIFVNSLIENPAFDSQTKENMTLPAKNFGSTCSPSENFYKAMLKTGVMEKISDWVKFKENEQLSKKRGKKNVFVPYEKLIDAEYAGGPKSLMCTLILTEGDSALNLYIKGKAALTEEERKYYGAFPLRGKLLNVRDASYKQIKENKEIDALCKIVGLDFGKKYEDRDDLKSLRYGKIMIMTDQDHDGSHIKGLIINFIHFKWPNLLKHNFLEEFITPICKATHKRTKVIKSFFSIPEFEEWKSSTADYHNWDIKYYKGLGTSVDNEGMEYFSDLDTHKIKFSYENRDDDQAVELAFSKKLVEQRKEWLLNNMEVKKQRREQGQAEDYLYRKGTTAVTYRDFVHKELILFSNLDNERSIPAFIDGFKPTQRKVIFTCFKKKIEKKDRKLNTLAGEIISTAAYHHGDASLYSTIGNLAQNFVGSNNINLLLPVGQFGSRNQGGKDMAAARYIGTKLSPLTRKIFPADDDAILNYLEDDNQKIEPEYYVPIIPMVLVNGADGIGTGWSTKVPNYNPREIIENLKRIIRGEEILPMKPWYKGYTGKIEKIDNQRFVVFGEIAKLPSSGDEESLIIKELPVRVWTETYKTKVLIPMQQGLTAKKSAELSQKKGGKAASRNAGDESDAENAGKKADSAEALCKIESFVDRSTLGIQILVKLTSSNLQKAMKIGIHKAFKLQTTFTTTSMVLFDKMGCIKRYDSPEEILNDFYHVRLEFYHKRKAYLLGKMDAEAKKLSNQCRFISEKNEGLIKLEKVKTKDIIQTLIERKYDSDPVKEWQKTCNFFIAETNRENEDDEDEQEDDRTDVEKSLTSTYDFGYLLDMKMRSMLIEREKKLSADRQEKLNKIEELKKTAVQTIWLKELDELSVALDEFERKEAQELEAAMRPLKNRKPKIGSGFEDKKAERGKKKADLEAQMIANAEVIAAPLDLEVFIKKESKAKKIGASQSSKSNTQEQDLDATEIFEIPSSEDEEGTQESKPEIKEVAKKSVTKKSDAKPRTKTTTKKSETKKASKSEGKKQPAKAKKGSSENSHEELSDDNAFKFDSQSEIEVEKPHLKVQKKMDPKKKPAPKSKKRKSWETQSSTDMSSMSSFVLSSDSEVESKPRSPRTKRARKNVNYQLRDEEEDDSFLEI